MFIVYAHLARITLYYIFFLSNAFDAVFIFYVHVTLIGPYGAL